MLLFIDRDKFIKLFRFGEVYIPVSQFIDITFSEGVSSLAAEYLNSKVPAFEQDHEILVLDIPKENLQIGTDIRLKISSVARVFPLTTEAERYLNGRLNPNIKLQKPVFENIINQLKFSRDIQLRLRARDALYRIYKIDRNMAFQYEKEIEMGIIARLNDEQVTNNEAYLSTLIAFNRNPIYPQGTIEYLLKAASVFVHMKGGSEYTFENGPLYAYLMSSAKKYNSFNTLDAVNYFRAQNESKNIVSELYKTYSSVNAFLIGVFFLNLKDKLNKHKYDLNVISEDIWSLSKIYKVETAVVVMMIGILFSFDNLYESIYQISDLSIFRTEAEPSLSDQLKIQKSKLEKAQAHNEELWTENQKLSAEITKLKTENKKQKASLVEPSLNPKEEEANIRQSTSLMDSYEDIEQTSINSTIENPSTNEEFQQSQPSLGQNESLHSLVSLNSTSESLVSSKNSEEEIIESSRQPGIVNDSVVKYSKNKKTNKDTSPENLKPKTKKRITNGTFHFPEPNSPIISPELADMHYNMTDINNIIKSVELKNILNDNLILETFKNAFLGYDPKGCRVHNLLNEITELQNDLHFSDEIALRLKEVIISKG